MDLTKNKKGEKYIHTDEKVESYIIPLRNILIQFKSDSYI